jgi:Tfp pilus assembly protein FimV
VAPEATDAVRRELTELRSQVTQLRSDLADLTALLHQTVDELERFKAELGG